MKKLIIKASILTLCFSLFNPFIKLSYAQNTIALSKIQTSAQDLPQITAESALTMDLQTGEIIYCKDADSKRYPASTTKLLTGLLLAENKQKTDLLQYTKSAKIQPAYSLNINYMNNTMKVGDKMSADDAIKGLLLYSGNDVAYMIADNISSNSKEFAALMNKRAKELGANNSNFVTANGLHDENHYTTAYDLSLITKEAFANSWVKKTMELPQASIKIKNSKIMIENRNLALGKNGNVAGKTGTTNAAGGCFAAVYERNGRKLIGIILKDRQVNSSDMTKFKDMDTIMNYSYNSTKKIYKSSGENVAQVEVKYKPYAVFESTKTLKLPIKLTQDVLAYKNSINNTESQITYSGTKILNLSDLLFNNNLKLTYKTRNHIEEVTGKVDLSNFTNLHIKISN